MALYDVTANGVALNSDYSGVDVFTARRAFPGRRQYEVVAPGQHGVTALPGAFEPRPFTIGMWIDGGAPGSVLTTAELEYQIGRLIRPFLAQEVKITYVRPDPSSPAGITQEAICRVVGSVEPEIDTHARTARLTIPLEATKSFWRGPNSVTITRNTFATWFDAIPTEAPIVDAVFEVTGPISNPLVESQHGSWFRYNGTLGAGQTLIVDNAKQTAKIGAVSVVTQMSYGGSRPRFIDLYAGEQVRVSGGGTTADSSWKATAKPAYF